MNPKDVMKNIPRQKHAVDSPDDGHEAEVENAETLMRYVMYENKYGDLEVAPGDEPSFDPVSIASAVQDGEEW